MRRALAAVALLAFLPSAHAQDKAKGEMTHSGEFRVRDNWMMNSTGLKGSTTNAVTERFKLDLGFKASDKLSAGLTLIQGAELGTRGNNTPASTNAGDLLVVNQAFGNWMVSDDFGVKVGRMNYQIADGTIMSINDWEPMPYAFEGILGTYEAEFGRIQAFAFKYQNPATAPTFDGGQNANPEQNAYGLNFDLKTMPEMLKMVNVHIIKDNSDALANPANGTGILGNQGKDYLRYGLNVGLSFNIVDLKLWYEAHNGKDIRPDVAAPGNKTDAEGNLMAAEIGANFAEFMNSRVWFKWHQDSGDDDTTDAKNKTYDGYFTEQHCAAGCMDLFGFGNLTFMQVGWIGKPSDNTEVGLTYWMFSRTKKSDTVASSAVVNGTNNMLAAASNDASKSKLGDEIDLWATHKYDNGLSMTARLGYFNFGDYYKLAGSELKEKPMQIFIEGRMSF